MKSNSIKISEEIKESNLAIAIKEIAEEVAKTPTEFINSVETPLGGE